jgi:hypothetical protein
VPNSSLLYCSEKCRREDTQVSSSSSSSHSYSSYSSLTQFDSRSSGTSPMKFTLLEPSRRDQWGLPASPTPEHCQDMDGFNSTGTSPVARPQASRNCSSRPLPPLHPRSLGSSPRTMDLVMPVYPREPESQLEKRKSLEYARRSVEGSTVSQGGLKKLFHFKELQTSPPS